MVDKLVMMKKFEIKSFLKSVIVKSVHNTLFRQRCLKGGGGLGATYKSVDIANGKSLQKVYFLGEP